MSIEGILKNIALYSHLAPIVLFVLFQPKKYDKALLVILFYCLYSFCNDKLLEYLIAHESNVSYNLSFIALSLFTIVEFSCFGFFIFFSIYNQKLKNLSLASIPLFIFIAIFLYYISISQKKSIDSYSITIEYILSIVLTLLYFFEEMKKPKTTFIYSTYNFWVIVGILMYSAGTFFLFMYASDLFNEDWENWSIVNFIFTIFKNFLFSVGIIVFKQETQSDEVSINRHLYNNSFE